MVSKNKMKLQNSEHLSKVSEFFGLDGKIALVPGGYGGLGSAIASAVAAAGATVVIAGRQKKKAETLALGLVNRKWKADCVVLDANSVDSINCAVDEVAGRFGRIDILINCVGIHKEQTLLEVTEDVYDEVYRTNLKAAMFLAQATARHQVAAGVGGRQIHLASVRAQLGIRNRGYSAYCSSKGGLMMLIKQHSLELASEQITVNGVAPTFVYTEMIKKVMDNPDIHDELVARIPLGRIASPSDVIGPVLFFCSDVSGFVTGQILYVDGGITASQ